ncbi:hypothetical protein RB195_019700 [Necator americanus]|uniref:Uncharacterized protein n=1 Tax=Necator americanus TaxID=51031 RepID=A0ABR1CFD7_NECAM
MDDLGGMSGTTTDPAVYSPTSGVPRGFPHHVRFVAYQVAAILFICLIGLSESGCYDNWSRCTPQTKFATGILWKDCPDYCRQCKGRTSGSCVKVHNKACSGGYQCQCSGGTRPKSTNPVIVATCKLGL